MTEPARDVAERALRYTDLKRFTEAERIVRVALSSEPEDRALLYALAHALHRQERYAEVLETTGAGLRRHPASTDLWHQRALALEELGRRSEAIEAVERGLAVAPRQHRLLWDYGVLLSRDEQEKRAVAVYRRALEVHPDDAILSGLLAASLLRTDEYVEGFDRAAASLAADPAQPDLLMSVADARMSLNHARSSMEFYSAAARQAPDDTERCTAVRYLLSWPISLAYSSLIWTLAGLSLLALPVAMSGAVGWPRWGVTAGTVAAVAYSSHWFVRGGTIALRGVVHGPGAMIGVIGTGVGVGCATAVAILLAVWLPSPAAAWLGLAGAVLLALTRAVEWALDPEEDDDGPVYRRLPSYLSAGLQQDLGILRQLRHRHELRRHHVRRRRAVPRT